MLAEMLIPIPAFFMLPEDVARSERPCLQAFDAEAVVTGMPMLPNDATRGREGVTVAQLAWRLVGTAPIGAGPVVIWTPDEPTIVLFEAENAEREDLE